MQARNTVPNRPIQAGNQPALYIITADLDDGQVCPPYIDDGQVCPPYIDDGIPWRVVHRRNGRTLWRRLSLSTSPVIDWRTALGDQARAP